MDGVAEFPHDLDDRPRFKDFRSMVMYDSFLDDDTYVASSYMYSQLESNYDRDALLLVPGLFIGTDVQNIRRSNTWTGGMMRQKVLAENVDVSFGLRVEDSGTDSDSVGLEGGLLPRSAESELDERRFTETLRLTYRGLPRSVVTFDAKLDQRVLDWEEHWDVHFTPPGTRTDRRTDITFSDQLYTLKATHRLNGRLKLTGQYQLQDRLRNYDERVDSTPGAYPGFIGDRDHDANGASLALDCRFTDSCSGTIKYQFSDEEIETALADRDTQDFRVHRVSASLTSSPFSNLVLVGVFMGEDYDIRTPGYVAAGANDYAPGSAPYDYRGDSFSFLLNATFALNSRCLIDLSGQRTRANGEENNSFTKIQTGVKLKLTEHQTLRLGYDFYKFHDRSGDGLDNYQVHGVTVGYGWTF